MSNSQSSERPDLQDLVAYMQGRGSEALRAQVLKRLDEDESYLELMMDLVPMLREAGELADPDAAPGAAPAAPPAVRPLVSPIASAVDAPLPPATEAPPSRVVPFPESPSRRRTAAISLLAAMIPAAVAIWIATRPVPPLATAVAEELKSIGIQHLESEVPWKTDVDRGEGDSPCAKDGAACFDAGAQMVDLQLAIRKKQMVLANSRLRNLATTLDEKNFERYFPGIVMAEEGEPIPIDGLEEKVDAGYRKLLEMPDSVFGFEEGTCLRATVLAAKAGNSGFFANRRIRKHCLAFVGEENWKADAPLEDLYFDARRRL